MLISKIATITTTRWCLYLKELIILFCRLVAKICLLYLNEDTLLKSFRVIGIFLKLFVKMVLKEL